MNEASVPYSITGPAIVKIFAPVPRTYPSVLASSAGATTELAKPVMGTMVPAPACFAILGYMSRPVKRAPKKISVIEVAAAAFYSARPKYLYILRIA